jgi:outer membrane usher protein FimD/PapC
VLDGDDFALPLGRDGQLFISNLDRPRGATVRSGDMSCRIYLEPRHLRSAAPQTAPLLCLREASGAY